MKYSTRQRLYVGTFVGAVLLFIGTMIVKRHFEDLRVEEKMQISVLKDFPVQLMSRLRPFIDDVLIPRYSDSISMPPKRLLPRTRCTILIQKLLEDLIEYSEKKSDSTFTQMVDGLKSLHENECTGAPIQCARVGMPKAFISLLLLSPFPPAAFKHADNVFLADQNFKSDPLLYFLVTLRMPRVSPDLISYGQYVETFINGPDTWNLLSLKGEIFLPSREMEISVPMPPSCLRISWKFENDINSRLQTTPESLTVNMPWQKDRNPFSLRQAHKFKRQWYVLMSAELNINGQVAKAVFDRSLQLWTLIRPDGRVQAMSQYFGLRFISTYATRMNFNKL